MDISSILQDLPFDDAKNKLLRKLLPMLGEITHKQLIRAAKLYSFDEGKLEFLTIMYPYCNDMKFKTLKKLLLLMSYDEARVGTINLLKDKVSFDMDDVPSILNCMSFDEGRLKFFHLFRSKLSSYPFEQFYSMTKNCFSHETNEDIAFNIINNNYEKIRQRHEEEQLKPIDKGSYIYINGQPFDVSGSSCYSTRVGDFHIEVTQRHNGYKVTVQGNGISTSTSGSKLPMYIKLSGKSACVSSRP